MSVWGRARRGFLGLGVRNIFRQIGPIASLVLALCTCVFVDGSRPSHAEGVASIIATINERPRPEDLLPRNTAPYTIDNHADLQNKALDAVADLLDSLWRLKYIGRVSRGERETFLRVVFYGLPPGGGSPENKLPLKSVPVNDSVYESFKQTGWARSGDAQFTDQSKLPNQAKLVGTNDDERREILARNADAFANTDVILMLTNRGKVRGRLRLALDAFVNREDDFSRPVTALIDGIEIRPPPAPAPPSSAEQVRAALLNGVAIVLASLSPLEWIIFASLGLIALSAFGFLINWHHETQPLRAVLAGTPGAAEDEINEWARRERKRAQYADAIKSWLDWAYRVTRYDGEIRDQTPFGPGAFQVMLSLAVAYPVITVLLVWLFTGVNTSGVPVLLPDAIAPAERALAGAALAAATCLLIGFYQDQHWRRWLWLFGAFAFAVSGAVSGAGAGAIAGAIANVIVVAVTVSGTAASTDVVAGAIAMAIGFVVAGAGAVAGAFAVAVAVAFAVAFVVLTNLLVRRQAGAIGHLALLGPLSALVIAAAAYSNALELNEVSHTLIIFVCVIPVLNAIFDYLSLGITRLLLAQSVKSETRALAKFVIGAVDVACAVAMLFGLAFVLSASLQALNQLVLRSGDPQVWINLDEIFTRLALSPGDPSLLWIYFMVFSTFVPSVLHLGVACWSIRIAALSSTEIEDLKAAVRNPKLPGATRLRRRVKRMMRNNLLFRWIALIAILALVAVFLEATSVVALVGGWIGLEMALPFENPLHTLARALFDTAVHGRDLAREWLPINP